MSPSSAGTDPGAVPLDDFPYEGDAGRTQLEWVHVTIPGGLVRSVQVYRVVNARTDPQLKEPALTGALHRFETGEELAIPFIYHDPDARKLALVLPETLRHRELHERSWLLSRLAEDTTAPIPGYVRDGTVVIGPVELGAYLTRPTAEAEKERLAGEAEERRRDASAREGRVAEAEALVARERAKMETRSARLDAKEAELSQRAEELGERERQLVQREERLQTRAETVTTMEDEHRLIADRLEAEQRELAMREQDLEARFEALRAREAELLSAEHKRIPSIEPAGGGDGAPRMSAPSSIPSALSNLPHPGQRPPSSTPPPPAPRPASSPPPAPLTLIEDEVEELDDVDALVEELGPHEPEVDATASASAQPASSAVEVVEEDEVLPLDDAEVHAVSDDELEPIEEETTGVAGRPEPTTHEDKLDDEQTAIATLEGAPEFMPPPGFLEEHDRQMVASFNEDRVWLFARLDEGREDAYQGDVDLLSQLVVVDGYPVVLLTLLERGQGRPYARRAALDPSRAQDKNILEHLRRNFAASAALFGSEGAYERTIEVESPRAENVALILERLGRMREEPGIDAATATERALAAPPPVRQGSHPFQEGLTEARAAQEAASRVRQLVDWSRPDKLDRALMALSVPRAVVDAAFQRILTDAVRFGIALGGPLLGRAVSLGIGPEPGEIVSDQIQAFTLVAAQSDRGGLSATQIADNWQKLLDLASENEVAIDEGTHEQAWAAIREVRGEVDGPPSKVDPASLPDLGEPQVVLLLDHPKMRRLAALELCRRGKADILPVLYKAVRKMPRADVVRIVPRVMEMGEAAGDVLIDGLAARKTFVRQASALALGQLKLRRAVVPMVHLLVDEPSDVWQEVARVLATFGTGALRTLARSMKDPKRAEDRFSYCLAHLIEAGCEDAVQKLQDDSDKNIAKMALEAMTLRDVVKKHTQAVQGERDLDPDDGIRAFSRRFYEEAEGRAPSEDLLEPSG